MLAYEMNKSQHNLRIWKYHSPAEQKCFSIIKYNMLWSSIYKVLIYKVKKHFKFKI